MNSNTLAKCASAVLITSALSWPVFGALSAYAQCNCSNILTITNTTAAARGFRLYHYNPSITTFPVPTFAPVVANANLALDLFPSITGAITGMISGNTLTVSNAPAGLVIRVGSVVIGAGVAPGTKVTALGNATGGAGSYTINKSQTVSAEYMSIAPPNFSGNGITWEDVCDTGTGGFTQCLHMSMGDAYASIGVNNYGVGPAKPLSVIVNGQTEMTFNTNGTPSINKQGAGTVFAIGAPGATLNASATPDQFNLGNDYSSTFGTKPKLVVLDYNYNNKNNQWGVGASGDGLDFIVTQSTNFNWWQDQNNLATLSSDSLVLTQPTPSTSSTTGALRVAGGIGVQGDVNVLGGVQTSRLSLKSAGGTCIMTPSSASLNVSCTSDERLKVAISDASLDTSWLNTFRVRDYTVSADGSRRTGVIAQELRETHPELVHALPDGTLTAEAPDPWRMLLIMQGLHHEISILKGISLVLGSLLIALIAALMLHPTN